MSFLTPLVCVCVRVRVCAVVQVKESMQDAGAVWAAAHRATMPRHHWSESVSLYNQLRPPHLVLQLVQALEHKLKQGAQVLGGRRRHKDVGVAAQQLEGWRGGWGPGVGAGQWRVWVWGPSAGAKLREMGRSTHLRHK